MYTSSQYARLMIDILPVLQRVAGEARLHAHPDERAVMFYSEMSAQLHTLAMQLPELLPRFDSNRELDGNCKSTLESVLQFFEGSPTTENDDGEEIISNFRFPGLVRLKDQSASSLQSNHLIVYNPSTEDDVLEKFDVWIKRIERMIDRVPPTTKSTQESPQEIKGIPPRSVRDAAMNFKQAADETWKCRCTQSHNMMLFLQTHRQVRDNEQFVAFDLLFGPKSDSDRKWQDGIVYVMLNDTGGTALKTEVMHERHKKAPRGRHVIPNLCERLKSAPLNISINARLEGSEFRDTGISRSRLGLQDVAPTTSLYDLIRGTPVIDHRSRMKLAVLVAYTVMHLSDTPWLPDGWGKSSFHLLQAAEQSSFILRPLLANSLGSNFHISKPTPSRMHPFPDLLQLGILLLEIFLKEPIEQMRHPDHSDNYDETEADRNFFAADWKYGDYEWDVHEEYQAAVAACLRWDVSQELKKGGEKYIQYIYTNIVRPLEREMEVLCKINVEKLDEAIKCILPSYSPSRTSTSIQVSGHNGIKSPIQHLRKLEEEKLAVKIAQPHYFGLFDDHKISSTHKNKLADDWFEQFESSVYSERCMNMWSQKVSCEGPVRVAILDSGMSVVDSDIIDNWGRIEYRDFVRGDHQNPRDLANHGTHVTAIILGVAKYAKLLVGRVVEERDFRDPSSISKGIRHATEDFKANIICMSFGFDQYTDELAGVRDEIRNAYGKGVILMAAAANHGGLHKVSYPANQEQVICISSTDGLGNASEFNPSHQGCNIFSTLGEGVPTCWNEQDAPRKSGTSFATPVAVGIAAVTIDYLRRRKSSWTEERRNVASRIQSRQGITTVMERHLACERNGFQFLRPWKLFEKNFDRIDHLLLDSLEEV